MALSRLAFPDSLPVMEPAVRCTPRRPAAPTLFVECTLTYQHDFNTGIQRVVRNILRHSAAVAATHGYQVVPVVLENGQFFSADAGRVLGHKQRPDEVLEREASLTAEPESASAEAASAARRPSLARTLWHLALRGLASLLPFERAHRFLYAPPDRFGLAHCLALKWLPARPVAATPTAMPASLPLVPGFAEPVSLDAFDDLEGCLLLLLDASWPLPIWPAVERFKARGGHVAGVVYDLIPITHPATCAGEATAVFASWIRNHRRHSDALVCISRSVATQLRAFLQADVVTGAPDGGVPINHFHLGSELDLIDPVEGIRPGFGTPFETDAPVFLMVGSIEPRKNHGFVLDAFDRFWGQGGQATLVVVGRQDWNSERLLARIAGHDQLGQQLFVLRDASDAELDHGYRHASALVIASEAEGFGLPIVEAFQHGLPILCSDIPVFREIADRRATFFDLAIADNLTVALTAFCRRHERWNRWIRQPQRRLDRHTNPLSRALLSLYRAAERRHRTRRPQPWLNWHESTAQLIGAVIRRHSLVEGKPDRDNAPSVQPMA